MKLKILLVFLSVFVFGIALAVGVPPLSAIFYRNCLLFLIFRSVFADKLNLFIKATVNDKICTLCVRD